MPLNAFIVRPFAVKEIVVTSEEIVQRLPPGEEGRPLIRSIEQIADTRHWKVRIDFEEMHRRLIAPTLERLRIQGETASAVIVAGNIREDMFNRLVTADLVIADVSIHNPNVFYELGIRQAFRDKYTFLINSTLSEYPFDLKTDRYFEYDIAELIARPEVAIKRLTEALRATISSYKSDSPIYKLLPQLEAEDRSRFIAVPDEFREEVERARRHQRREHLGLLAVECEGFLWEIEGLRVVGRAQFESNFIHGAKRTWEQIVGRYPDDVEANTVLSTIYQRMSDSTRSEQALARVSRVRSLSANRLSQLRSLSGRNMKEAWIEQWRKESTLEARQRRALTSALLERSCEAYQDAFKADLNNSYAGLNALTLLVIQVELAQKIEDAWRSVQSQAGDAPRVLAQRQARIRQLIAALQLAVESDHERLSRQGAVDPWFSLLEAGVACIVSDQSDHVTQLYEAAKHFAPMNAEDSMRRALEVYRDLDIGGRDFDAQWQIGNIHQNVTKALGVLGKERAAPPASRTVKRILMFVGLRLDGVPDAPEAGSTEAKAAAAAVPAPVFPATLSEAVRTAIEGAIQEEMKLDGEIVFGMAAGANGGDLLFHEVCGKLGIHTHLCLALPKPQYLGQYVAPAGRKWVERFLETYHRLGARAAGACAAGAGGTPPISVFSDSNELPRWLQGKPFYNVGRRNSLWMLHHALTAALDLGESTEVTLLALWHKASSEGGIGGIGNVIRLAEMEGIKVHVIEMPTEPAPPGRGRGPADDLLIGAKKVVEDRAAAEAPASPAAKAPDAALIEVDAQTRRIATEPIDESA